jgi:hypothetical protein
MTEEIPRLSASIAHKLTTEGPLSAWANHRLLGGLGKPPTDAQQKGQIAHAALLGHSVEVAVLDFPNFKTKDAREARDEALADGKTPVTTAKWEEANLNAPHIRELIAERHGIDLANGTIEKRWEWTEFARDGSAVECSGYTDYWDGALQTVDLKTGDGYPTPEKIANDLARSHGVLQDRAYRGALAFHADVTTPEIDVVFLGVQMVAPFATCPVRFAGSYREVSELRWQRAIDTWADCEQKNVWPVKHLEPALIDAPGWLLNGELAEEVMISDS